MTLSFDAATLLCGLAVTFSLASFLMKRMLPLRVLAMGANFSFIGFAIAFLAAPDTDPKALLLGLLLNTVLLPVNAWRAWEIRKLTAEITSATHDLPVSKWLLSHMRARAFKAGEILFQKGDPADKLTYVLSGELILPEIGKRVGPGELLGEIGIFSPDNRRSLTLQAESNGEVYEMTREKLFQLYYQNPKLGFSMMRLLAGRSSEIETSRRELRTAGARVESELGSAREIQLGLVPGDFPEPTAEAPVDIFATLLPARQVGGDLYDFFYVDPQTLCMVIADVSDKGAPAALFMAHANSMLRLVATLLRLPDGQRPTPANVLARVNEELCRGNRECMFVTVFFAMLDLSSNTLSFCNAGHNIPYLINRERNIAPLEGARSKPLGIRRSFTYATASKKLGPGDTLFLYTDGITEAMNGAGDLFDDHRLRQILEATAGSDSRHIVGAVMSSVRDFAGATPQSDDIAAMAVRLLPATENAGVSNSSSPHAEIVIKNQLDDLPRVARLLDEVARAHAISSDVLADLQVALDEVLANTIEYAYPDGSVHEISVGFRVFDDVIEAQIEDDGLPFDPLSVAVPDTSSPVGKRPIGGLGIHLVRKLMSEVTYARVGDRNRLVLRKNSSNHEGRGHGSA